ncbi:MAG: agmatinase [Syntrophales bacterium]|nr:agmatinase [Syntrophales bacterium]
MNFGDLEEIWTDYESARFVVLPVPYDLTASYLPGSRRGPAAIIDASSHLELYDEELDMETYQKGIHTLPFLEIQVGDPQCVVDAVRNRVTKIISDGKIPVVLGGEHTVTLGAVLAAHDCWREITVLYLDAHADMRDVYQGSKFSHACVARRISEICPLVQIGVRSLSFEEKNYIMEKGLTCLTTREILNGSLDLDKLIGNLGETVYITVDVDVLDSGIMPATGTPEPGGISWMQLLDIVKCVCRTCRVIGFDIVELCPVPGLVAPDFLVAKTTYRIMGYLSLKER